MKHTISLLVENRFGVLAKISTLFSARGFNIDSLAVGETEDPTVSRMTIISTGEDRVMEQIKKQLNKLVDVIKVRDFSEEKAKNKKFDFISRELILVKVNAEAKKRPQIIEIADIFRANIVNVNPGSMVIEMTGDEEKIEALLGLLRPFGLVELTRTGKIALARR
jgi:acetolactate synthase-1/3 small subunit